MKNNHLSLCAALAAACLLAGCATPPPVPPIELNLVAFNDFHGHLEATKFSYTDRASGRPVSIQAGGIAAIGAALKAWRQEDKDLIFVGAGDLVGASPAMSSMWADEPSITALGKLGLNASSVGNHEFDAGRAELLRQQYGGCASPRPAKACQLAPGFAGAPFRYLAANVLDSATGKPILPAYTIVEAKGVKVALIGAVLRDTASVVMASSIVGLSFTDEAEAVNRAVLDARAQGATVFVLMIHEGGHTVEAFDEPNCKQLKGPIVDIAGKLDPALRLIVSGHTHNGYQCELGTRVITQAEMGGHALSRIKLTLDPATRTLRQIAVRNVAVRPGQYPADPAIDAYLATVKARSKDALTRPVARIAVPTVGRVASKSGETALGDLVTDAFLAATRAQGVQIAFTNMGGIRKDLDVGDDLSAEYGEAQIVLPFANTLVAMDMTGAELRALLEQQWMRAHADAKHSMLQVSHGFSYRWNPAAPAGKRLVAGSVKLNGEALDDNKSYRITTNNFLADGGDGFPQFAKGRNRVDTQIVDLDAFVAHLAEAERAGKPAGSHSTAGRIEQGK
ncbi:bifunctional metallophosphatase/5'-nucleotidase [Massilia glaciei]|uniref:Bifunctional metallophosphatase/5'-nucleotidase n=1 Tax=Massilia glaciei TaxID=1524097 RepID=A0A2U2HBY5_9BURK|nr:bifunctional metallophosphatase/5'-nucleotidase [Massilia glaciei]PWF40340.1 bifunctional metallophosphatase/5'-nucleotidase [Massilia glaciei]